MISIFVIMKKIHIASSMILSPDKEMLMVRKKGSTFYQLAGGKIDYNETAEATVTREIKEELGLDISELNIEFLGTHQTQAVNEKSTVVHGTIFKIILSEKQYFKPNAELEEVVWIDYQNYKNFKFAHLAEEFVLPKWLALRNTAL
jgi:8-oxo-dGTP diphosphatase